jgi:hypothetical protein
MIRIILVSRAGRALEALASLEHGRFIFDMQRFGGPSGIEDLVLIVLKRDSERVKPYISNDNDMLAMASPGRRSDFSL